MDSSITFDRLPVELKLHVFSYFDAKELNQTAAKICKKWRRLCADPSLWGRLCIDGMQEPLKVYKTGKSKLPLQIAQVLNRNKFVRHIKFNDISNFKSWIECVEVHNNVKSIEFSYCRITKSIAENLVDVFPNVQKLFVDDFSGISIHGLSILTCWSLLKSVEIRGDDYQDIDETVSMFTKNSKHLTEFYSCNYLSLSNKSFEELMTARGKDLTSFSMWTCNEFVIEGYIKLAETCVNLTYLLLSYATNLTDSVFLILLKNLPCLETIRIMDCETIFTVMFSLLFKKEKFNRITELGFSSCDNLNDSALCALLECCPMLKDINIFNSEKITNKSLPCLPTTSRYLEFMQLVNVNYVTEDCLQDIANQLPELCVCVASECPLINGGKSTMVWCKPKRRMRGKFCECLQDLEWK